ncbi:hypothetical protein PTR52_24385 [Serratia nevei]|uniref:hypothetical protein n=1 Tax=Serratia TaxID=613 RepID=UPI000760581F|nr:hypothetical protein [Serratia marcescens]
MTEVLTYEALKAERDALAVENQALSAALSLISGSYGLSPHIQSMCAVDTPTTDAALSAIEARGVEKFADDLHKTAMAMCSVKPDNTAPGAYAGLARSFAKKLREAK